MEKKEKKCMNVFDVDKLLCYNIIDRFTLKKPPWKNPDCTVGAVLK